MPLLGVDDLGVEQHARRAARSASSIAATGAFALGRPTTAKPGGRRRDEVAVAHPDAAARRQAAEERAARAAAANTRLAELAVAGALTSPPSTWLMSCMP